MSSVTNFFLNPQANALNSRKFPTEKPLSLLRYHIKIQSFSHPAFRPARLNVSRNGSEIWSRTTPPPPLHRKFIKFLSEKVVTVLLGSFIFMGFVNTSQSLALSEKIRVTTQKERERKDENEEMWEKVLESDPKNVEALKVLVYGKIKEGRMKEAVKYVERLISVEGEDVAEWRLLLGLCYETMGRLSTAKRIFREILLDRPLLLRALHGLAMVMHKNQEGPAIFEMLNEALERARREKRVTEERNIRILTGQMHVLEGNLEAGLKEFQDLVRENPRDFRPYLCQGIIYSLLNKKKEAQQQFDIYQDLVPEETPQRGFLDDVILVAKSKAQEQLKKEFGSDFPSE